MDCRVERRAARGRTMRQPDFVPAAARACEGAAAGGCTQASARGLGELLHRASRPAMLAEDAGPKHERPLGRTGELCPTEQGSQPACHAARVLSVALPFGYLHRPLARPAEDRELRRGKARRFAGSCRGSAIVSDLHGSSAIFLPRNSCKLRLGNFTPGHGSTGELMSPLPRILPRGAGTADARRAYRAKTDAMSASV